MSELPLAKLIEVSYYWILYWYMIFSARQYYYSFIRVLSSKVRVLHYQVLEIVFQSSYLHLTPGWLPGQEATSRFSANTSQIAMIWQHMMVISKCSLKPREESMVMESLPLILKQDVFIYNCRQQAHLKWPRGMFSKDYYLLMK